MCIILLKFANDMVVHTFCLARAYSYVGASLEAYRRHLMSKTGLRTVIDEARREFAAVKFDNDAKRAAREAELEAAATAALAQIAQDEQV